MPAPAIIGAVVAVAAAVEVVTPVAIALAVVATAGAVASTVGTITGDKTLSMVGNIMGAVGSVGSIANGLGVFGEMASVTNAAGGAAESVAPTAVSISEATGGLNAYTPEFLQSALPGYAGTGSYAGGEALMNGADVAGAVQSSQPGQIVNMLSGETTPLTVPTAEPPAALQASEFTPGAATNTAADAGSLTPNPAADLNVDPSQGLLQQPLADTPPQVGPSDFTDPTAGSTPMVGTEGVPADYMSANATDPNAMPAIEQGGGADWNMNPASQDGQGGLVNRQGGSDADWAAAGQNSTDVSGKTGFEDAGVDPAKATTGETVTPARVSGTTGMETPASTTTAGAGNTPSTDAMLAWKDTKPGDITRADNSLWGDILGFVTAKENRSLMLGGFMTLGSFMTGALNPKTQAEVEAQQAQAEKNRAAAALENTQNQLMQRRLNNMSQSLPVARRTGLVNMAPVSGRV